MSEIELKLQIPSAHKKALATDFAQLNPSPLHLVAYYYDTPQQDLAKQQISLRQRLEHDVWKQTLKAPSQHAAARLEIDIALKAKPEQIDLKLYKHSKQAQALLKPVLKSKQPLVLQFSTDVKRHSVEITSGESRIELALDDGWLNTPEQKAKISEIEFELMHGQLSDLIASIRPWVNQYKIYLDLQSKAQRGYALYQTQAATYANNKVVLARKCCPEQAFSQMLNLCLQHLLPNASALARGDHQAEHLHQVRVAIRRLTTLFKVFSTCISHDVKQYTAQLKTIFRALSGARDQDALSESLIPKLIQAGAPIVDLPVTASNKASELKRLFRAPSTTLLWLDLIALTQHQSCTCQKQLLPDLVKKSLHNLEHKIVRHQHDFLSLDLEHKHQLRKRVKQLRYALELSQSVLPKAQVKAYLKALKPLQEILGEFQDLSLAEQLIRPAVKRQPEYWFALGWLQAEQQHILQRAERALQHFAKQARL